ncbi:MAG: diguanylate cyclase [Oscillospiraceae bacterium]|nr:diguanylate cyclase [Oscillospiraceae bacterium]
MRKFEIKNRKRIPIRRRLMRAVLLTTVISILAVSITGYFCIRWIRRASEKTLTEQLEINLKNIAQERAGAVDARLLHYEEYIRFIVDSIENMYAHEEEMLSRGRMFYPPTDTREYTLTRAFASDSLTEEDLRDDLYFFSNLESIWEPIAKENEDLIFTLYLGTKDGLLASYDRYPYLSCPPEGKETVYNYFVSEWYRRGMAEDGIFFTGVYMDSQGRGLTVTVASRFRDSQGEPAGVACLDFDLSELYDDLFASGLREGTFIFALDDHNTVISPDSDILDIRQYTGLTLDELDALRTAPDGILEKGDSVYVCIPMERVGWTMCASVPMDVIQSSIHVADSSIREAVTVLALIVAIILLAAVLAVNRSVTDVTFPLELLGRDIKTISDGNLNYRATVYRNDEIGDITSGMNEMVDRLNFTLNELMSTQQHADAMSRLATRDALTGIRNKTAFDEQTKLLAADLARGEERFGFALLDLNDLKLINDNYGHEKGDIAIKNLSRLICEIFSHSPVFRVGGDEFVVILKNEDYENIESLVSSFRERILTSSGDRTEEPWERISAAVGYALYDKAEDTGVESVLARSDQEMYACKKSMKKNRPR